MLHVKTTSQKESGIAITLCKMCRYNDECRLLLILKFNLIIDYLFTLIIYIYYFTYFESLFVQIFMIVLIWYFM